MIRQINLLPERIQKERLQKIIRNNFLFAFIPLIIFMMATHFLLAAWLQKSIDFSLTPFEYQKSPEMKTLKKELEEASSGLGQYYKENGDLIRMVMNRSVTTSILKLVGDVAYKRVWLDSLDLDLDKMRVQMSGHSENSRTVSEFMLDLKPLAQFKTVELISMEKSPAIEDIVNFSVQCHLP